MSTTYPHLGFNPAPGSVETVKAMEARLRTAAGKLSEAHKLVERLRASDSWEGDAAVAFREELDGALPTNLKNANTSLLKAAAALKQWGDSLHGYQETASRLDGEAKDAKKRLNEAKQQESTARSNPDLKLANQTFTDEAALADAQARLDRATNAVNEAVKAVNRAQGDLNDIIRRARDLEQEHTATAKDNAKVIRDAADKLAPEEPHWFTKAMDWLSDNLTDVLGACAAIAGLLAIIATGPLGVGLMLAAAALSAATLVSRLSDPKVRASLKDGFTKGEFDSDFWSNAVGVVGDVIGAVPGVGAVARGVNGAVRSASASTEALTLGEKLASASSKTWLAAERISDASNPLTTWLVKGASNPDRAGKIVDLTVAGAGATTATYGVTKNIWEGLKHPAAENTATVADGVRAGTFDAAGNGSIALKAVKVILGG